MKVLHVITSLSPLSGGPTVALRALASEQANQGHEVVICTTNADNPRGVISVQTDTPIFVDQVMIWYFSLQFFRPLCVSGRLARWINNEIMHFDIIHIHGLYRFPPTYAAWRARLAGVPYLIRPHGNLDPFLYKQSRYSLPLKRIYERLFDIPCLNHAAAIHYTADEEAKQASFLDLRSKPVIVPNGIDWQIYRDLPPKGSFRRHLRLSERTPLVLFLGRINFKKGLDFLVPAFCKVAQEYPDARLAIVGPDNEGYGSKVKRWCREQCIEDKILFVDHLGPEEVVQAYVDADVFVLPSYTENFGMAVVEAMACGCPVVISNRVNIWRKVQDAGAGIVVNLDPCAVAKAINRVLADASGAKAIGARGRIIAGKKYAWPRIAKQLTGVYQELIEKRELAMGYRLSYP